MVTFSNIKLAFPTRLTVAMMMFTACMMSYMLRVNMSINILDMVEPQRNTKNGTARIQNECTSAKPENYSQNIASDYLNTSNIVVLRNEQVSTKYEWNSNVQGLILGAYFWGYIVSNMPAGLAAQRWGPRLVVGLTAFLSGALTMLSPLSADLHHGALVACRFLIGALAGFLYPSLHSLVAYWAPPDEKGKFIGALMGGTFGTVVTWSFCGVLINSMGWRWAFYIPGLIMMAWSILWFILVTDVPDNHPRISDKEKAYITDCIGDSVKKSKKMPPFKKVFSSVPVWAFNILHFGSLWGLYFLLTAGPKFMTQVLGFDLSKAGLIASLPYLCRLLMSFVFGAIGDSLRKNGLISITATRKLFCLFSHLIPGILLVALTFVGCSPVLSVVIITASLGVNGASTITNLQNHQDLAPNYAGALYGIANCIGSTTGFITPAITGYFTKDHNGLGEWRSIFLIGASVYFISGIIFMIFGSGVTQTWNSDTEESECVDLKQNNNESPINKQAIDNNGYTNTEVEKESSKL